ncbi:MAG: DUF58 domain-containing protein [Planctomycetaceae bacterium]
MTIGEILSPVERDRIKGLQLTARQVVEGFCSGLHRSPHKGYSIEFKEHRPYVQGDEIRAIDWKVFGKTDRLYIREFEEETNLRATLVVDSSGSMSYAGSRTGAISKYQYAIRLAASLAYLMIGQQDGVGLATFDTRVNEYLPARSRASHLQAIFAALLRRPPGGETELGDVLSGLAAQLHRRGLMILISDCFGDVPRLLHALTHFRRARHEVLVIQVLDPDELEFPFTGRLRFRDLERVGGYEEVDAASLRNAYRSKFQSFCNELADGCGRARIDLLTMYTDKPFDAGLAAYLASRRRLR